MNKTFLQIALTIMPIFLKFNMNARKPPLLQKQGSKESFSISAYWGDMYNANLDDNKNSNFNVAGSRPFMEASAGIENIFHIISIEYYRRLNYLNNPIRKDRIYLGLKLSF